MDPSFHRLGLLLGDEALEALAGTAVIVFGLGGVGSWAAEALVRSGVGRITIVDSDFVCVTNINRQVQALRGTVGLPKAAALMKRLLDINPSCKVSAFNQVFSRETAGLFEIEKAAYVIDAIDSLTHKLDLIERCFAHSADFKDPADPAGSPDSKGPPDPSGPKLFSSMGMASRLDPGRIKTADIWESSGCPLARLVRQGLRRRGFKQGFTVVYSDEKPIPPRGETLCGSPQCLCSNRDTEWCSSKRIINGSAVTVSAAAGMILAGLVVRDVYSRTTGSCITSPTAPPW